MLFKRYASPLLLLDQMIATGQLYDFVEKMMHEVDNDLIWEYFLHKVYDKSYDEFVASISQNKSEPASEKQIETTIQTSKSMLSNFRPEQG